MPTTTALLKTYGNIPIPNRIDEMTYQEVVSEGEGLFEATGEVGHSGYEDIIRWEIV